MTHPLYKRVWFTAKPTVKYVQALALLSAVYIAPLSASKAQTTVFLDFTTNDIIGENIIGQTPDIASGTLEGQSAGTLQITTNYCIDTVGAARLVYGAFTSTLGPGQQLYPFFLTSLNFGPVFPNSGGFAGVSLYTGYSSYSNNATGNEEEFRGRNLMMPTNGVLIREQRGFRTVAIQTHLPRPSSPMCMIQGRGHSNT